MALKSTQADYLKLCGTISQTPAELQNVSSEITLETTNEVGNVSMKSFLLLFPFSDDFFSAMQCDYMPNNELAIGETSVSGFNSSEW